MIRHLHFERVDVWSIRRGHQDSEAIKRKR